MPLKFERGEKNIHTDELKKKCFCISFFVFICGLLRFDYKRNCFLSVSLLCCQFFFVCVHVSPECRVREWTDEWKNKSDNALLTLFSLHSHTKITDSILRGCGECVFLEMSVCCFSSLFFFFFMFIIWAINAKFLALLCRYIMNSDRERERESESLLWRCARFAQSNTPFDHFHYFPL